jgi:uncharacterized protein
VRNIFIVTFNTYFHLSQYRLLLRYTYLPPEILRWDPSDPLKTFTFVDGGMTPYNNPTFLLFRMATHRFYRLEWKTGKKNLLLISVATGMPDDPNFKNNINMVSNLAGIPGTLMHGIQIDQDINCRIAGRCTYGDFINRVLRDLACREAVIECTVEEWQKAKHASLDRDLGRAFLDALGCSKTDPERVQKLDAVDQIENLIQIGLKPGDKIKLQHLGPFVPKAVATS